MGWSEIVVILLVVLLLFGTKRIPELAKALGKASYEFKKAKESIKKEGRELLETAERKAADADADAVKKSPDDSGDDDSPAGN